MSKKTGQFVETETIESDHIPADLLEQYGASVVHVEKDQVLFQQGDQALFFHVVRSGCVKMTVYNEKGREFVQGYFSDGESFGEPPFFCQGQYPASAVVVESGSIWRCAYQDFLNLLAEHPGIHLLVTQTLCKRLVYKATMLGAVAVEEARFRLQTLIEYLWKASEEQENPYKVPFTRQQLADMTGLRVETVIRVIKGMEEDGVLKIRRGKIYWMCEDGLTQ